MENTFDDLIYKPLSRNVIKYIVIIAMTLDHVAHLLPQGSALTITFSVIGRITGPTMAFFIAQGYVYTRNVKKYALRLLLFAFISWIPFVYFETGQFLPVEVFSGNYVGNYPSFYLQAQNMTVIVHTTDVMFSLLLGLLAIIIWDSKRLPIIIKILLTIAVFYLSFFCDWKYWNVCFCLAFYFARNNDIIKWSLFILISLSYIFSFNIFSNPFMPKLGFGISPYRFGIFLVIPLIICLYNGKKGSDNKFHKWFFYIYYPAHLFVLGLMMQYLF